MTRRNLAALLALHASLALGSSAIGQEPPPDGGFPDGPPPFGPPDEVNASWPMRSYLRRFSASLSTA